MFYGETIGLDKVLAKMQEFEGKMGDDFKPSALLKQLASEGKGFKDAKVGAASC
jgi:3-hydroxyacyl-CoA dehydrogenase